MLRISPFTIERIADDIVSLMRQGKLLKTAVGGGLQSKENEKDILKNKRNEYWLAFVRRVTKDEIIFRKGMVKYFEEQEERALKVFSGKKIINKDVEGVINVPKEKSELKKLITYSTPKITQALLLEGKRVLSELKVTIAFDILNPKVVKFIETRVGDLIKSVSDTTKEALRDALKEGIDAGESIPKLAKRIESVYDDAKGYRSTLIARTENITAHNNGALNAYRQSEVVEKKTWLTAGDERVRPEHAAMDGETVGIEEAFSNGLMVPSEPNCRCTILPVLYKE